MNSNLLIHLNIDEFNEIISRNIQSAISNAQLSQSNKSNEKENKLLTRKQLSELLDISYVTINKHMRSGRLPYKRLGRRIYFDYQQVIKSFSDISFGRSK